MRYFSVARTLARLVSCRPITCVSPEPRRWSDCKLWYLAGLRGSVLFSTPARRDKCYDCQLAINTNPLLERYNPSPDNLGKWPVSILHENARLLRALLRCGRRRGPKPRASAVRPRYVVRPGDELVLYPFQRTLGHILEHLLAELSLVLERSLKNTPRLLGFPYEARIIARISLIRLGSRKEYLSIVPHELLDSVRDLGLGQILHVNSDGSRVVRHLLPVLRDDGGASRANVALGPSARKEKKMRKK